MSGLLRRKLGQPVLAIALALLLSVGGFGLPTQPALADAGNNDPWGPPNTNYAVQVPGTPNPNQVILWGYTTCPSTDTNCMSGSYVGSDGKTYGYTDPWGYALRYCTNHVAWVSALNTNGTVQIEEYNNPAGSGAYYSPPRAITYGSGSSVWFIHVKHLNTASPMPGAVTRDSSDMDNFYVGGSNALVDRYWNSSTGWNSTSWSDSAASAPSAVARTSSNMDVLFRNTGNNLVDRYWSSTGGWNVATLVTNGTVRGNPKVIALDSNDMDVFYRDNNNNLVDAYWSSTGGWNVTYWTDGLNGSADPAPLTRSSSSMDIMFRNSGNNLVDRYWSSTGGWNVATLVSNGTISADPGVVNPDSNHMDAFYRDGTTGNLYDRWWDSVNGWNTSSWSVAVASGARPSAIARTSGNMDVFFRNLLSW